VIAGSAETGAVVALWSRGTSNKVRREGLAGLGHISCSLAVRKEVEMGGWIGVVERWLRGGSGYAVS
jgi:hypothetical protein